jgi:hypothetical protein
MPTKCLTSRYSRRKKYLRPLWVLQRKEGYIGRVVTLRIDNTVWRSSTAKSAPGEFRVFVGGWVLKGDRKIPFAIQNSPRIEVGGRYTMPLVALQRAVHKPPGAAPTSRRNTTIAPDLEEQWGPLSPELVFATDGDATAASDIKAGGNNALAKDLAGLSRDEVASRLTQAATDPAVSRFSELPPVQRYHAALREQRERTQQ